MIVAGTGAGKERIPAHRQILAASSEIFKTMLFGPFVEGNKRELTIPNIEPCILRSLLQFMYTGAVELDTDKIVPIIKAAD